MEASLHTPPCFPPFSTVFVHQAWTVDAAVGDAAGTDQHAVSWPAGEVAAAANRAVILALRASELQTQPKARGKVCRAQVTDERHLISTAQQDLHAHMEADLAVRAGRGAGPCCAPRNTAATTAEGAPAPAVRVGATSFFFFFWMNCGSTGKNTARKIYEKRYAVWEDISELSGRFMGAQCLKDWSSIPCSLSL